jgi:hypothetical protein
MEIPARLYKYTSVSLDSLVNLLARIIYFGSPKKFNDPYDCALSGAVGNLSDSGLDRILQSIGTSNLHFNRPTHKEVVRAKAIETINDYGKEFLENRGVSCFSETNDNLLMWSHYADACRGMCLEFDTTNDDLFQKAKQVRYVSNIPVLDLDELVVDQKSDQILDLFCTKSDHWSYEREWRVIHQSAGTKFGYRPETLTAVYVGPRMSNEIANLLVTVLRTYPNSPSLNVASPCQDQFRMEFREAAYRA